jgi:hypothetical protein
MGSDKAAITCTVTISIRIVIKNDASNLAVRLLSDNWKDTNGSINVFSNPRINLRPFIVPQKIRLGLLYFTGKYCNAQFY